MHIAVQIVALVVVVAAVAGLAERVGASPPLILVGVGVIGSYVPMFGEIHLDPDLVLIGLIPPLLYAAAIEMSLLDFRRNKQAILLLSVGLVAFTTVVVGYAAALIIPGISLAAAFAIGAVVAPPDAVAASAVGRRVGMPRPIVSLLEGESLINDATALVALDTAVAAVTHHVTTGKVVEDFMLAAGGGVLVGLLAATVLAVVRKRIDEPVLDTTLSFVAPYVAFLPAQAIHASGVLAVVITGLALSHNAPKLQSATSRISETVNWQAIRFLLENSVFLLIGLQLRSLVNGVADSGISAGRTLLAGGVILLTVILARVVWVFAITGLWHVGTAAMRENKWSWPTAAVVSWSGMRGVVTLAAVFLLPTSIPQLALLKLVAFFVVAGTLVMQGLSLPTLVRRLQLAGPDAADDALQAATLIEQASRAGLRRLEEVLSPQDPVEVAEQLRQRAISRSNQAWERLGRAEEELEPPSAVYRRLRLQMLEAERDVILRARDSGTVDFPVLRTAMAAIDSEESLLDPLESIESADDRELTTRTNIANDCTHLRDAPSDAVALSDGVCEDCLLEGTTWVHLRICLTCGNIGCCDSSVARHATRHFHQTQHPVMRSAEPGEGWRWCYVDERVG